MNNPTAKNGFDLADFFSAAEGRNDRWRSLHRVARALSDRPADKLRTEAAALLAELTPLEELQGYPGPRLMTLLRQREQSADWSGFARLVLH